MNVFRELSASHVTARKNDFIRCRFSKLVSKMQRLSLEPIKQFSQNKCQPHISVKNSFYAMQISKPECWSIRALSHVHDGAFCDYSRPAPRGGGGGAGGHHHPPDHRFLSNLIIFEFKQIVRYEKVGNS